MSDGIEDVPELPETPGILVSRKIPPTLEASVAGELAKFARKITSDVGVIRDEELSRKLDAATTPFTSIEAKTTEDSTSDVSDKFAPWGIGRSVKPATAYAVPVTTATTVDPDDTDTDKKMEEAETMSAIVRSSMHSRFRPTVRRALQTYPTGFSVYPNQEISQLVDEQTDDKIEIKSHVIDIQRDSSTNIPEELRKPETLREVSIFSSMLADNMSAVTKIRQSRVAIHGFPSQSVVAPGRVNFSDRRQLVVQYSVMACDPFYEETSKKWPKTSDLHPMDEIYPEGSPQNLRNTPAMWFYAMQMATTCKYMSPWEKDALAVSIAALASPGGDIPAESELKNLSNEYARGMAAVWMLADEDFSERELTKSEAADIFSEETFTPNKTMVDEILSSVEDAEDHAERDDDEVVETDAEESSSTVAPPGPGDGGLAPIEFLTSSKGYKYVRRPNGSRYYARKMPVSSKKSPATDVEFVRKMYDLRMPVLLYGDPGTGKTALAEVALPNLVTLNGTGDTETADFIGSWTPSGPDEFVWIDGPLITAMQNGWPLLIDEIALIDPRVMSVVYGVMDGRGEINVTANPAVGTIAAAPGFYVIGACNPNVPGAVMSDALLSRFSVQLEVTTDYSSLEKLGIKRDLALAAKNLNKKFKSNEIMRAPQLRELLSFEQLRSALGAEVAVANMISSADENDREVYESVLSSTFATKPGRMTI